MAAASKPIEVVEMPALHDQKSRGERHVSRFEAVRRHVFLEMQGHAKRWIVLFFVPLNLSLVTLFVVFGGSKRRAFVEVTTLAICQILGWKSRRGTVNVRPFAWGAVHFFVLMALTGGIASPMLPYLLPLVSAAVLVVADRRSKTILAICVAVGIIILSILSATRWGAIPPPLANENGSPTGAYLGTICGAMLFALAGLTRSGFYVTDAYARVARELAARREEICEDSTDNSRALEGVAAKLAHEVKNPLSAIKALSTHMARSSTDPKTAERLGIVASEADRLQSILDGFLSFSRGLSDLKLEPTKPYEIGRELVILLETRLSEQGLAMEILGDDSIEIMADGRKLRQSMLNLVLNAMEASARLAKTNAACAITIAVVLTKNDRVRIRVIDRGVGMTKEVIERIQKPYFSTREGGSGLGVAVARAMVEQHGGDLRFESRPNHGTTATIELPRIAVDSIPLPQPSAPCAARLCAEDKNLGPRS